MFRSEIISVSKVFDDYYQVPDFQREYKWTKKNANQLISDVNEWFYNDDGEIKEPPGDENAYFLGLMVVSEQRTDSLVSYQIIDAQQRITTLYLLFCAIRHQLLDLETSLPTQIENILKPMRPLPDGTERRDSRLVQQYQDDREAIESIYNDGFVASTEQPSHKNMQEVYDFFINYLKEEHGDTQSLNQLLAVFTQGVYFARITTPDTSLAINVFEKINARGEQLTPIDLIKNQLFSHTPDRDQSALADKWKYLTRIVLVKEKKPIVFFRYFVASDFTGRQMNEINLYDWFKGTDKASKQPNLNLIADSGKMLDVVKELTKAAVYYAQFIQYKDPMGTEIGNMENIALLGGSSMRQQNFLFMGGRDLSPHLFKQLAEYAENFIFYVLMTKQQTNFLESRFSQWGKELRGIDKNDKDAFALWAEENLVEYMRPKQDDVRRILENLCQGEDPIKQKYRIRYILAKLAQHIQKHTEAGEKSIARYCGTTYEVDQIASPSATEEVTESLDDKATQDERLFNMLGNLTLLQKARAKKVKDWTYEEKRSELRAATLLMTKAIVAGQDNDYKSQVWGEKLEAYSEWNAETIAHRQQVLADIGMHIWSAPIRN